MAHTVLVTGGNRGIGFEACRQLARQGFAVVLTARDAALGDAAAAELAAEGLAVRAEQMDVGDEASVTACAARLRDAGVHVGVLVNNAGVYPEGGILDGPAESFREGFEINTLGAVWTSRAFVPAMLAAGYGRVVNVSSGCGSFAEGLECTAPYAMSKVALNAVTVRLARELTGDVKVNALCPGWVRTRMGGDGATRSPAEGAETIVWLATLPSDGPNGGFFRDREPIPW